MIPSKNIPQFLDLCYSGYNRGLPGVNSSYGDFQPIFASDGSLRTSFCNQFVNSVLCGMGYPDMNGMIANEMVRFMQKPENGWVSSTDEGVIQGYANTGVMVIAGISDTLGHGHVCLVLPGILEQSMSYGRVIPKCVSVGKTVFFGKKVSFAFSADEQPQYWFLGGMV